VPHVPAASPNLGRLFRIVENRTFVSTVLAEHCERDGRSVTLHKPFFDNFESKCPVAVVNGTPTNLQALIPCLSSIPMAAPSCKPSAIAFDSPLAGTRRPTTLSSAPTAPNTT